MAEGSEIDERVDLDDDNYMEETDEDVADVIEDEAEEGTGDEKAEEQDEELKTDGSGKEQSPEPDRSPIADERGEDEEKHASSINEEDKEKHTELLSLPPYGSEVFIGGLPKDATEEDLRDLCEPIGEIYEVRLMKNKDTGEIKGYAFVAFKTKDDAQRAIEELKNKEFKGKTLRCSLSDSKHRLFIGNIPKSWSEDQFKKMIHDVGPGAEMIDLKQVKALYVKNIPDSATPEQLKEIFQRHGEVTKVVLPPAKGGQGKGNFGFIHFGDRSSALKAIKDTEKYEID
ncbi:Heterogeneous nuclear ribonucleoprotein Q, partial [Bienertia sinuspersici]